MAALAKALTASGAVTAVAGGRPRLHGWSIAEAAGTPAAAEVKIFDGTDNTGALLAHIKLAASGSHAAWLGDGVVADSGSIFFEETAGAVSAVIYHS